MKISTKTFALSLVIMVFLSLSGCGAKKNDADSLSQNYRDSEYGFSFRYPKDWQRLPSSPASPAFRVAIRGPANRFGSHMPDIYVFIGPNDNYDYHSATKPEIQNLVANAFGTGNLKIEEYGFREFSGKKCGFIHWQHFDDRLEELCLSFNHKNKGIMVMVITQQGGFTENRPIFESILNSFNFD